MDLGVLVFLDTHRLSQLSFTRDLTSFSLSADPHFLSTRESVAAVVIVPFAEILSDFL